MAHAQFRLGGIVTLLQFFDLRPHIWLGCGEGVDLPCQGDTLELDLIECIVERGERRAALHGAVGDLLDDALLLALQLVQFARHLLALGFRAAKL
ncbi:hypothetical protein U0027_20440 [Agrobacterium tumefaciens]|uniref:hypothetical protein n=1 Tax=Agrobacterium tumefaciens TaxID=358 RepID=UPI0021CE0187|nr:hypothetical protein [Agrobacterium tumefaciens]WQE42564.1 hypothetical protein U0027_20440 [Agrobacterium tumefaciens]